MPRKQRKQVRGRRGRYSTPMRRAVTLVEVLLVLVVLTLIAATAWPSLQRSFADQRLRDAADLVRAEWAATRAEAMRSGAARQFCYAPQEQTYWVEPCEDALGASGESATTSINLSAEPEMDGDRLILPDEIFFHEGKVQTECSASTSADQFSQPAEVEPGTLEDGEPDAPIVFHPDGTCSSARLVLRNEFDRGITVTLRGLTGMSESQEIFAVEEGLP